MKLYSLLAAATMTISVASLAPTTFYRTLAKRRCCYGRSSALCAFDDEGGVPLAPRTAKKKMSDAIPFLICPSALSESKLAGNVGFDPLGFAKNQDDLVAYREAEIKHARLAMLAAAGWPASEVFDRQIADTWGLPSILDTGDRVPAVLNDSMGSVAPAFWGFCLGLTAAIDLFGIAKGREDDPSYFPGNLGFDPLRFYPDDMEGRERMELAEIKHGRLAMIAVTGYAIQEFSTKVGVVDETPFFFHPLGAML